MMGSDLDQVTAALATGRWFRPVLGAPVVARRFARDFLADSGADRNCQQAAELLVSELLMNAVEHAHATARLSISVAEGIARIEVSDDGPGQPRPRKPDSDGGYGLWLVDWLAQSWGISQPNGHGKTVWLTLPLSAGHTSRAPAPRRRSEQR